MRFLLALALCTAACTPASPKLEDGITAKQHQAFFPIGATDPHALGAIAQTSAVIECQSCHGGTDSFDAPLCIACHQHDPAPLDAVHGEVAGFEKKDSACLTCHPNGLPGTEQGTSAHSSISFPIDPGDVHGNAAYTARIPPGGTSCTACHASVADRSQSLCATCHAQDTAPDLVTAHAALASSFSNDSDSCKECHADIPIDPKVHPMSGHDTIFDPAHHDAPARRTTCKDCHGALRTDSHSYGLDFGRADCTGCHTHPAACSVGNQAPCNSRP